ncbi:hypothetical protein HYH03_018489 [Edaphochlamys debaryana]|uniref:protein-tyrosine-phosphatase n=1 Tax=Edaphochlamys debaryana TaxID=47281 RepID=A0A836BN32_9CHLO|nr:hypothetical protein HYH03_018489 [Edaphochlamys debaryana]|eukprot:KAG2482605.1 hypothetical protein HYH03_018489 [Edaphochlamys debaryana]
MATEAKSCDVDQVFRIFTALPQDIATILIDVRPQKEFKLNHIAGAFNVRLSTNGQVLADYSGSSYNIKWSQDCWWGRSVVVYGDPGLRRDHPVLRFLAGQARCRGLSYLKEGYAEFEKKYPFLCTASVKAACLKRYPSQVLPGHLYLGDWDNAADGERLAELGVKRVLTIHNHPENLRLAPGLRHLRFSVPDIEDVDISQYFSEAFDFIDEARDKGQAVLVHCGAGVSRSATLVMMYLMRRNSWSAARARAHVLERRSCVRLNDGFWITLCALEPALGITDRSDPDDTQAYRGANAPEPQRIAVALSEDAAGGRVAVEQLGPEAAREARQAAAGQKRGRGEAEGGEAAKRARTDGSGAWVVELEVRKPEGLVGLLRLGPMRPSQRVVLGRAPGCDVVLEHASISRQHAALSVDRSGAAFVTDLGSGHGTKLGDTWLKANAPRQLQAGAGAGALGFGASTRRYTLLGVRPAEAGEGAGAGGAGAGAAPA